jgi:hypothetical protein
MVSFFNVFFFKDRMEVENNLMMRTCLPFSAEDLLQSSEEKSNVFR